MADLSFRNIKKVYDGNVVAVHDFNLNIKDKEFVVFVGPSGCGKSTTLRMVAGLESITDGELYIGDTLVNNVAPKDRDIAMVFQNYALYPHMTVYNNMAFSIKLRKVPREEIDKRVREAAEILGITEFLQRKPKALSGGQRQRVAIARALINNPAIIMADEPTGNLDTKSSYEIMDIFKKMNESGKTVVMVTHEPDIAEQTKRILVMRDGQLVSDERSGGKTDYAAIELQQMRDGTQS